jgi:glutamine synthetase
MSCVDEDIFADGVMFDGSSIAGWKAINESDMVLMLDTASAHGPVLRPVHHGVFCDILDPITGEAYNRDPRMTAKKAEAYVQAVRLGDTVFFGPEAEFFIFDDVRGGLILTTPASSSTPRAAVQHGHRLRDRQHGPPSAHQGRLLPGPPIDSARTCAPKCSPSWRNGPR